MLAWGLLVTLFAQTQSAFAESAEDIRLKIEAQQAKIASLEKEIAAFEATLVELGTNKNTLENEIARLDTSRKKLAADIRITEDRITTANLEINRLGGEIGTRETSIEIGLSGIRSSLRNLAQKDDITLLEQYFATDGIRGYWVTADDLLSLENSITTKAAKLAEEKEVLVEDRDEVSTQRAKLASLQTELRGQKAVLDGNRAEQAALLSSTKKSEATFQKLLTEKVVAKEQFEQELNEYESALEYTLDPSKIPSAGSGTLTFPLDANYMRRCADRQASYKNQYCISQYFGDTPFARSGAYNGKGHNGIDFGAPQGTKIVAAQSGTVVAIGNTDLQKGCYSYGKWVLVRHGNGLSTLYAHLSHITVGEGTSVPRGGLLGYSGKTGYATGPHLHFAVFVSDAVKIVRLGDVKTKTKCANVFVPVAPTGAYLNPISYL